MSLLHRGSRALAVLVVAAGVTAAASSGSVAHAARSAPAAPQKAAAASTAQQAAADPTPANTIFVDNSTTDANGPNCSDTASDAGSEDQPFCTINAAASAAQPGDTVMVEPYSKTGYGPTTISVSGTAAAPIIFQGATIYPATVTGDASTPAFTISGAHYVTLNGFTAGGDDGAYEVNGQSSNITINGGSTSADSAESNPNIQLDSADHVTVSRVSTSGRIQVNQGATNAVITANNITSGIPDTSTSSSAVTDPAVNISGQPGTEVVGNTIVANCTSAISAANGSNLTEIENNVFYPKDGTDNSTCTATGATSPIPIVVVSPDSTPGSTTGYNLFDDISDDATVLKPVIYKWNDLPYNTPADFSATTGQGTKDLEDHLTDWTDPGGIRPQETTATIAGLGKTTYWSTPSAAVDSANSDAPGELPTDELNHPHADAPYDPSTGIGTPNTGAGTYTYFDRGAVEADDVLDDYPTVKSSGPMTVTATLSAPSGPDTTNVPATMPIFIDFGDNSYPVMDLTNTGTRTYQHTYQTAGGKSVGLFEGNEIGTQSEGVYPAVGADYTSVTPKRVMDTRNGTGVAKGAVAGNGTVTLPVTSMPGVPADATAVVLNLTETGATGSGYITAYPGNGTAPTASNINYTKGTTIPNQVTVPVSNGEISFKNGSGGTVQLVADLQGYYSATGDGYAPQAPTRVLDTRNGTGAAKAAIPADGKIQLNLTGKVPAGTTAVTLNVTAAQPGGSGWLSVYPDSSTTPTTSDLNFTAGQTIANLVTVPLNNGIADLYNGSGKTVQAVADLEGTYGGTSATDTYVPDGPSRIIDTRNGIGTAKQPIPADGTLAISANGSSDLRIAAPVDNITVTQPTGSGYLTAYPDGATRPVASTLNFNAGNTLQNLSVPQASTAAQPQIDIYNGSGGTAQVIVDEDGYFITNQ